jgi:hypothetical protein
MLASKARFLQAVLPLRWPVVQRHFPADESHFTGEVWPCTCGIKLQLVPHRTAQQLVHRLLPHLAQQIPQGQIHPGDGVEHQALASVKQGAVVHLVPDALDIADFGPFHETRQMALDDESCRLAACSHGKADIAGAVLNLHHQRAQHIDAKAASALPVGRVFGHRRGDVVVNPVAIGLIVIIRTTTSQGKGTDVFDDWHLLHGALLRY